MAHQPVEEVLREAEYCWEQRGTKSKEHIENELYKKSFVLGYLQSAYRRVYEDLPKDKKAKKTLPNN